MTNSTLPQTGVTTYNVDTSHSNAEFAVRHLMISTVKGNFADVSGTLSLDEDNVSNSHIEMSIPVATIDTRQAQRDAHLRSPDFFDTDTYPVMKFESTEVEQVEPKKFRVSGQLTIKDVTKPVTLHVEEEGRGRDPWGGERVAYSANTKIDRREFGLTWNQVIEAGGVAVGNDVKIQVDFEAVKA